MTTRCPICQGDEFSPFNDDFLKCMLCSTLSRKQTRRKFTMELYKKDRNRYDFPNWNNILYRSGIIKIINEDYMFNASTIRAIAMEKMMKVTFPFPMNYNNIPDFLFPRNMKSTLSQIQLYEKIPLTLGIISKIDDFDRIVKLCMNIKNFISHIVIVLDAEHADGELQRSLLELTATDVRILAHPLGGDFAAQRNRVQAAAATRWVLHLDTDEMLSEEAKRRLPYILQQAEAYGRVAISMARQNIVDGVVSAHFPDTQVRLLQRTIRFTRRVHEYPEVHSRRTLLALNADILHIMDSDRLGKREALYEKMLPGAGRPSDTERLRRVLPPDVPVIR